MTIIEIDYILWNTERAGLSETNWGLTKMKKKIIRINMKLINSSVADEVEIF